MATNTTDSDVTLLSIIDSLNNDTSTISTDDSLKPYQICLIIIGSFGLLANAFALLAMASKELLKHPSNLLIMNQMALDLFSCVFIIMGYSLHAASVHLNGPMGFFICNLFYADYGT